MDSKGVADCNWMIHVVALSRAGVGYSQGTALRQDADLLWDLEVINDEFRRYK